MTEARTPGKTRTLDRVIWTVSCLLIALPVVFAFLYVRAFGVSVVFSDAWSMVPLFDRWSSGTLRLSHLLAQHNEHRMFFPKGVELLLGSSTRYDNVAEMYVIQTCFLAALISLLLVFRSNVKSWLFLFLPVSLLVFGFRQYENMLFGFQINFAFAQMFGVLALSLLYVSGRRKNFEKLAFFAALGSGTIASFSTAQGLFVWPAGLLQLFLSPTERPAKKALTAAWGLAGLVEWVVYFVDYSRSGDKPSLLYVLSHPMAGVEYFLNLLGSPLFWQQSSAFASGLLLVCLALTILFLVYRSRKLGEYSFWISLLLYSFLILTSITLGRSGFGAEQAMAPRYTSFSVLAAVSIYMMLTKLVVERGPNFKTVLLVALSGIVLLSAVTSYPRGIEVGKQEKISRERAAFVLSTYESQPDEILTENLNPRARVVRERAPVLQKLSYNVFSEPQSSLPPLSELSPVASSAPFGVTMAGDGVVQEGRSILVPAETSFIRLTGWAVDADNESTAGGVYVDVDGELFPAFYGTDREDVADSFGAPSYKYSGFERAIPTSEIGVGTHDLAIIVLTNNKDRYYRADQKVTLEVR